MALNIKDSEADRLVRELVAMTGESITDAVRTAFAERFEQSLFQSSGDAAITAANLLEAMLVIESRNPDTDAQDLRALVDVFAITVEPVTHDLAELRFRAWRRFGKGRHPATLSFGGCFAYALSKHLDAPLAF